MVKDSDAQRVSKRSLRWPLFVVFLLLVIVDYHVLMQFIKGVAITPLDDFLHAKGYLFNIKDIFDSLLRWLPGAAVVLNFVDAAKKKDMGYIVRLFNTMTSLQLIIWIIILPFFHYALHSLYSRILLYQKASNNQ